MIKQKSQSQKQQKKFSAQRNKLKMAQTFKTFKLNNIKSRTKDFVTVKNDQIKKQSEKKTQIRNQFNNYTTSQTFKSNQSFRQFGKLLNKFASKSKTKQNSNKESLKKSNQSFNHQKSNPKQQNLRRDQSDYLGKEYHGYLSPSINQQKDHFGIKKTFDKKIYSPNIGKQKDSFSIFWASKKKQQKQKQQKPIIDNKENQLTKNSKPTLNSKYQSNASLSQKIHDQIIQKYFGAKRKNQDNPDQFKNKNISFNIEALKLKDLHSLECEYQFLYTLQQCLQGKLSIDENLSSLINKNNVKDSFTSTLNLFSKNKIIYNNLNLFFKIEIFFVITFQKRNFQEFVSKRNLQKVLQHLLETFSILFNMLRKIYQKNTNLKFYLKVANIFKQFNIVKDKNCLKNIIKKFQSQLKSTLFNFHAYFDQLKNFKEFKKLTQDTFSKKTQSLEDFQNRIELLFVTKDENLKNLMCDSTLKDQENVQNKIIFNQKQTEPNFIFQPTNQQKYLREQKVKRKYTLVIDLDETLVHFEENNQGGRFLVRPYTHYFLQSLNEYFELVIFTAAMKDYADWIIDKIDKNNLISYRLYRQHTILEEGVYNKDLSKLGRCLMKTLIIDNNCSNFQRQPENGILIKNWYDDPNDIALKELCEILIQIAKENPDDIREAIKKL